jgi:1-acyl-sn-glycerol-3-phosphate acyltransferase
MKRSVAIVGGTPALAERLAETLGAAGNWEPALRTPPERLEPPDGETGFDCAVYADACGRHELDGFAPQAIFDACVRQRVGHLVVLSSAAVNEPNAHNAGRLDEDRLAPRRTGNPIPDRWLTLEAAARQAVEGSTTTLTVLRPAATPLPDGRDLFSRLLVGRLALTLPGYDPTLQLLSLDELAAAVVAVLATGHGGTYNLAPAAAVPLRRALRHAGVRRLPVFRALQWPVRKLLARSGRVAPIEALEYIRYPWTVSDERMRREIGFAPVDTSAAVAARASSRRPPPVDGTVEYDDFGLDRDYIAAYGRTLLRFLHDVYWRVEYVGLEHLPRQGRGVLTGVHRGFMPWDGVMAEHLIARDLGRFPRFLVHPTLVKFPFLTPFMTKLGGILACRENAAWVLEREGLLAIFPEGIRGAFLHYRDAYRLGRFSRDEYVKIALRHRAPILPFVTVGSAEIFPILGKINWPWWKRYSEWPCFPITPTMGLVPLPSKWHTRFLEPLHVERQYPPEAADDLAIVREISSDVRQRLEVAIAEMRERRRSIFWGNIFGDQPV